MQYKLSNNYLEKQIFTSFYAIDGLDFIPNDLVLNHEFFENNVLLAFPIRGSSTLSTYKLLYIDSIIEDENKIQVICKYNLMPMLMDLRQYTLFVPYHKTDKEIELVLK